MFNINAAVKWVSIIAILGIIAGGLRFTYKYHLRQIDEAVNTAILEVSVESEVVIRHKEEELRNQSIEDKKVILEQLKVEKSKVSNLERMLLIDHDLDRLLQSKPDLILTRVNKGTADYFKEIEEITK